MLFNAMAIKVINVFSLSSFTLRFNNIKSTQKDLMMNNFIKQSVNKLTSRLSPIVLTTLQLSLMLTLMTLTMPSFASDDTNALTEFSSYSQGSYSQGSSAQKTIGAPAKQFSQNEQLSQNVKERVMQGESDQSNHKALNITREAHIKQKQLQAQKLISANFSKKVNDSTNSSTVQSRSYSDGSFAIYQGYTQLIEDYDVDGFYQSFSVTFDADLITYNPYNQAIVYAELYLSENGGPWQHYYTTDDFIIYGESSDDDYEVYSTLSQGFNPNHYDVLIDLYEVGYPNIVASYSSDDSNSLYALPLESSDYDAEYVEYYEEVHVHGGSNTALVIFILALLAVLRTPKLLATAK
jgi:hypothetical protein